MTCKEVLHMARSMGRRPSAAVCQERRSGSDGAPCCVRRADLFCKSSFAMQAWKAAERAGRSAGERGERPLPNSLPFPLAAGCQLLPSLPSFLPSPKPRRNAKASLLTMPKKRNITSRDLPNLAGCPKFQIPSESIENQTLGRVDYLGLSKLCKVIERA